MKDELLIQRGTNNPQINCYNELGNAIIEKAAYDLRKCMRKDKKHNRYSYEIYKDHSMVKTSSIAYFFSSPLAELCCGTINPLYIIKRIAEEEKYPYMVELIHDYERGLK